MINFATGEDDEIPLAGDVGAQASAPVIPMPPPPSQAPGVPAAAPPVAAPPAPSAPLPPAPGLPQVEPYKAPVPPPIPVSRVVTPAEAQNLAAIDRNAAARQETAQDRTMITGPEAVARQQEAERAKFLDEARQQERQRIADEAAKRIQARTAQADKDYEDWRSSGLKDPQASDSFATRLLKGIAIGMGQYAAGINGGPNAALGIIQEANRENIARQKAEIEKKFQAAQRSGKNVEVAMKERDDEFRQMDLKFAGKMQASADMLRNELARIGIPRAQIDANKEIQQLEAEALATRERTLASIRDDETALARADIMASARRARGAGGAGGGTDLGNAAQLAEYAQKNPGDSPGLYTLAAKLYGPNSKAGKQAVADAINQNKIPEGAQGTATKAQAALRAIDRIDKMHYTPSSDEIQKWLNNQRQVAIAEEAGKKGGASGLLGSAVAGGLQGAGLIAQNEYSGLSPRARMYFTNVRQYMENIGREASGAAISQGEWNNFYGQYGPQSEGGLEAARQNIRDRFKLTGVAARSLEASSDAPTKAAPVSSGGGMKDSDPRVKLAREAINDPNASQAEKARALQILRTLDKNIKL